MRLQSTMVTCIVAGLVWSSNAELVHRYTFNGNVNDVVGSFDGNSSIDGVNASAPSYTTEFPVGAMAFGPTNSLEVGIDGKQSGFQLDKDVMSTGTGSISLWFNADTIAGGKYLVAGLPPNNGLIIMGSWTAGKIDMKCFGGAAISTSITTGAWHHVAVTWDASVENASFYFDGSLLGSATFTNAIDPYYGIRIGGYNVLGDPGSLPSNQFDGKLYDIQFYDHVLAADEVDKLHTYPGYAIPPKILIHRYVFNNSFDDVVGSLDGTSTTESTYSEVPLFSSSTPSGVLGLSMETGMNNNTKKSGFSLNKDAVGTQGTVAFWMKADSLANGDYLMHYPGGFILFGQSSTKLRLSIAKSGGGYDLLADATVSTGVWTHVVFTWNNVADQVKYYVNGVLIGSASNTADIATVYDWRIGSYDLSTGGGTLVNQFDGKLCDLQIYGAPLSGTEVAALYADPGSVSLRETAFSPVLVALSNQTVLASAVVTNATYAADPSGTLDAGSAIQSAIDDVAGAGGGVVFIPAGWYRVEGTIVLKENVTLVGEWDELTDDGIASGTVLLAYASTNNSFISSTDREVGIQGICIYYPDQNDPENIQPYPPTLEFSGSATLRKILLCNSYYGIRLNVANGSVLEQIVGTVLSRGAYLPYSSEFSWVRDVCFSNECWENVYELFEGVSMTAAEKKALNSYTHQNLIGLELQRLDGLAIDGFNAEGSLSPVLMTTNTNYSNPVFGFGGVVANFPHVRDEFDWAPWYYGMHYANVDRVPEVDGKYYTFATTPQPVRTDVFIDVTRSPYAARGDLVSDDTFAIQAALDAAGASGGGTVYLPIGSYKVTSPLTVPDGVELRGPMGTGKVREYRKTCAIACYYGHNIFNPDTAAALITLENNAGVRGFSVVHPDQPYDADQLVLYPYTIRGNGTNTWVVDMILVNSWNGIDLAAGCNDGFLVRDLWATAFNKGIDVGGGSVGGKLERLAFSVGPVWSSVWFSDQRTQTASDGLSDYITANNIEYSFGASSNLTAWGLAGFHSDKLFQFYDENGACTENAELWLTMSDVQDTSSIQANRGSDINLFGFWATSYSTNSNWLEVDTAFQGPLNIYGKTIHQPAQPNPLVCTAQQVGFFDEVSLTSGKIVSADQTLQGSSPAYAVDRDLRTCWEAPAGSFLEVDLGEVMEIDRFDVESDRFASATYKITRAELHVSTDGVNFDSVATNQTSYYWMSMPIAPVSARYVRVYPESSYGTTKLAGLDLFYSSAGLLHRYVFSNNVDDVEGSLGGTPTVAGTYTEAPLFSTDIPSGGTQMYSIEVGMNMGSKKSGFELNNAVIAEQGTLSLWIKPDTLALGQYLLNLPGGLHLAGFGSTEIGFSDGTWNWITATVSTTSWTHVVITWNNAADTMEYFVNGARIGTQSLTTPVASTYTLRVGNFGLADNSVSMANQYDGKFYDLQIYDFVLSDSDIDYLYANPGDLLVLGL